MQKLSVNLLQAELIPQQALWTLKRVVTLWGLVFIAMFAWMSISQLQHQQLNDEFSIVNSKQKQQAARLTHLELQISKHKADPALEKQLATLKLLLVNKKALHTQLTDTSTTYAAGFSMAMTELSELHHRDISLQKVKMMLNELTFSGLARKPEAVPLWLAAFEDSTFLAGKSFTHFSLSENEDKVTEFVVSSNAAASSAGE